MDGIRFKSPKKLKRVEIIRSRDVKSRGVVDLLPKPPVTEYPKIDVIDITDTMIIPVTTEFTDHTVVIESKTPLHINTDRLPVDMIPISEAQLQVQEAYEKGFADGQKVTLNTYRGELETHQIWVRRIDNAVKELVNDYSMAIKRFEESLVPLAIMTAEHILLHEISGNSNIVIEQVKKAIQSLDNDIIFKLHLNPDDMIVLKACQSELHPDKSKMDNVLLSADSSVDKGGCILETSSGIVDARIKTQLDRLKEILDESHKLQISQEGIDVQEEIRNKIEKFTS